MTTRTLYKLVEGGAIYTSEIDGKFLIIIDENCLANLLDADELEGLELLRTIEFTSEAGRSDYLLHRFGPENSANKGNTLKLQT